MAKSLPSVIVKRFLLVTVLISGCSFYYIEKGLNALVGKDVRYAFDVLGYPNGEQEFGSETAYIWQNSRSTMFYEPRFTTDKAPDIRSFSYRDSRFSDLTPSGYWVPMQGVCVMRIIAGPDNIVRRWDYNGDGLGCDDYVSRLKDVAE